MILKPAWFQIQSLQQSQNFQNVDERFICIEQSDDPVLISIAVAPSGECSQDFQSFLGYQGYNGFQGYQKTADRSQVRKQVPLGYVHLPGSGYYKYHSEYKKFNDARKICTSEGGHLAIFNSEAEAKFVASIPDTAYDYALIGTHDIYEEGQWVTVLDQELHATGYNKWHQGEPNGGMMENCGVVFPDGKLGDFNCHFGSRSFFCEIKE
ncbi:hypothetical protein L9F63_014965 [Diploptera punctata]|uniref:C-type lectin domain-containing protein n=1 Tax=Diploptera punctata TaxID=6984 RepID=A0AAD8A6K2_DIPPU|nr:hypothetical protein L9F63_014965 [Diploptera punctata]